MLAKSLLVVQELCEGWCGWGWEKRPCVCVFSEFRDGRVSAWAEGNGVGLWRSRISGVLEPAPPSLTASCAYFFPTEFSGIQLKA